MFPYHYGSYATIFNGEIEVSLPKFPYHYGSYATEIEFSLFFYAHTVSIPLWFLRNSRSSRRSHVTYQRFHTTMVLTQLARTRKSSLLHSVSIPLWFLRNSSALTRAISFMLFPYHYGSYATKSKEDGSLKDTCKFPYHYGSYATFRRSANLKFPY